MVVMVDTSNSLTQGSQTAVCLRHAHTSGPLVKSLRCHAFVAVMLHTFIMFVILESWMKPLLTLSTFSKRLLCSFLFLCLLRFCDRKSELCFPPNSVSTLRGSYGSYKGRCLIRVFTLACGILPVNFRIKWLLWNLDMRFDCAGSHKVFVRVLGFIWSAAFYL